jgi:hypothetical protein|tara:strand:- start:325 stop:1287 length:963 start_codon:yes stop_codon:yes gene_type:complete
MAQTQINKGDVEVDLDTDDVKAQNIQVEPAKIEPEEKEVSLQKEEVEQEGAEINRDQTPIDVVTESKFKTEEDDGFDLNKASDSVQKRINKLTRQRREADRRADAALQYAQGLKSEINKFQSQYPKMEENYLNEFEKRLQTDEVAANSLLQKAIEGQDAKSIVDANQRLTQLAIEKERLSQTKFLKEQEAKQPAAEMIPPQNSTLQPQGPSIKAQEWADNNPWFHEDDVMHDAAIAIHKNLLKSGVAGDSDEYYNQLDKRIRNYFPNKFNQPQEQRKPVQTVAPAVRNQGGRKTVRLTKSQVAIAKKLGVPLEEYAKYVK